METTWVNNYDEHNKQTVYGGDFDSTFSFARMSSQSLFPGAPPHNDTYSYNYNDDEMMLRFLGAGGEKITIDYSVFGMTMVTLVFIFTVGVIRHQVEHWTRGNDVFELVLETCYHELSTLGIVEAVIFILHKYYKELVIETEKVFAEVHFTLFFVVIFNTIMSSLLYVLSCQVANKRWARMEAIDLDHYVAVRKQFEDVNKKLDKLKSETVERKTSTKNKSHVRTVSFHLRNSEFGESSNNMQDDFGEVSQTNNEDGWAKRFWLQSITRKTVLYRKQRELLVQVRFHDLRVHFIESHKLPPNFRISDYLKLCMNDEFKNLIELTSFSWTILMGIVNLTYFVMGVVYSKTVDVNAVGNTLTGIFLGYVVLFVPMSYITYLKMNKIFFKFVSEKAWIQAKSEDEDDNDKEERTSLRRLNLVRSISTGNFSTTALAPPERVDQKDYFWGGNPSNVVTLGQLMQFGYAISFAVLLVFNSTLKTELNAGAGSWYFILPSVCCYILFLMLWCVIMPKYTQCTSLGDLVRKKHLVDIDARSKLNKAQTKREEEIDYLAAEKEVEENMEHRTVRRKRQDSSQSNLLARFMGKKSTREDENHDHELDQSKSERSLTGSQRLKNLSELVKQPTKNLPDENIVKRRRERRRAKSVSDGVAAMRLFSSKSAMAQEALNADPDTEISQGRLEAIPTRLPGSRRPRQKMVSTGVFLMQSEKPPSFFDESGGLKQDGVDQQGGIEPMGRIAVNTDLVADEFKTTGTRSSRVGPNTRLEERDLEATSFKLTAVEERFERKQNELEIHDGISEDDSIVSEESVEEWEVSAPEPIVHLSLGDRLRMSILHKSYTLASALFGTMVLFFCLGLRIELILLETCEMTDHLNTWNFLPNRVGAFWIIFFWLLFFIAESSITCMLFGRKGEHFNAVILMAGIMDIILSGVCLSLFLWAEIERCCSCNDGENYSLKAGYSNEDSNSCESPTPDSLCCPTFGSRLCHGLGSIEPIVALIALRIFRFQAGQILVSFHDQLKRIMTKENDEDVEARPDSDEYKKSNTLLDSNGIEHEKRIDFNHETGTIAELWILALSQYPEIVNEHGIFSGLVLEAMLGINPLPDQQHEKKMQDPVSDSRENPHHLLTAESIIKAGKTKMPRSLERGVSAISMRSAGGSSVADLNIHDHNFLRPAAPLIRSMRRCECKWKWLKSSLDAPWEVVDVVLTEFEIVWFDAKVNVTYWDQAEMKKIRNVKEAIISKKGGKGLRLIDVAAGREILGRLALSDIDRMRLSRIMPSTEIAPSKEASSENFLDLEGNETAISSGKTISKEYWNDRGDKCNMELPLQKQFERVMEDRLKLHSTQGTLFLRFLVDLYHNIEPALSETEIEKKKGALLWCESISHLCGQDQLKQKLPHFGEGRDDELKDFIEITSRMNEDNDKSKLFQLLSFKNQF